ncbi:hypothetical protein DFH08DRAFT_972606 [Mycena albidolilacea]|uniref:Uncharacterized protein n=1 Tax=Mycena albidolilacea TaxID=1033008 RepID=A0AAD6ZAG8_9AGAR|nr:hypothetical protein DFH08DRAFT_972606 [Mycena albidolilacea]
MWLDFLILGSLVATGSAEYVPFLQQGFLFDYNIATQPVPIPITEQCETIHIEWKGAIGPNPVAPYSMVVYTSTFLTPFTIAMGSGLSFDWVVPFAPGTQYQICMWDSNGVPGGCQAMYIVIQNSTVANPTCQNITFPALLDVEATVPDGPMSQYGWIDQCTDLSVTPKSGKPPFTLTVAPALHPPYNVTSNSMETIDWTVSLSWSIPFFLSLASADGQLWSYGPLHAGVAPGTIPSSKVHRIAIGAGLGGAFATGIIGALGAFLYFRDRNRKRPEHPKIEAFDYKPNPEPTTVRIKSFNSVGTRQTSGHSQPTAIQSGTTVAERRTSQIISPSVPSPQILSPVRSSSQLPPPVRSSAPVPPPSRAYVLHHDAGHAPITVITNAEEVVELPPRYRRNGNGVPLPSIREKAESLPSRPMRVASTGSVPLFRRP